MAEKNPVVLMTTSKGNIRIELDAQKAPITTKNFLDYVSEGHYDGLIFHRVIPGFMVQGGGMDAQMKEKRNKGPIKNEAANGLKNDAGTIAMARTNVVDSATSQFFINVKNNDFLNHRSTSPAEYGYAVFGQVIEGMDVVQSIETGPFLTMLIFVGTGLAVIPWLTMVSVIAPIVVGAILGNLDEDLKQFFGTHEPIIVPFMAFTLGQTINLKSVVTAGLPGVALGVTVLVVTGAVCIVVDRLLGGSGIAGAAASSTAGNSAAVPQAVALADTSFAPVAAAATVQVTASVIVTAILTPLLTAWWFRKVERSRALEAADQRVEEVTAQRY